MVQNNLIKIDDKFHLVAEKLSAPITLNDFELIKEHDLNLENILRSNKEVNTNDDMQNED